MDKVIKYISKIKKIIEEHKKLSKIALAVLIMLITVIVIISCVKGNSDRPTGNNFNMGLAAQEGKWIYYITMDDGENVGINKVKENGKKSERILDGDVSNINVIDNYIYCLEYDENEKENNLIKVKTNGKNKKILARDIDEDTIVATDKYVFYFKNSNLYRIKLNGTDKEKVSDKNISYYQIKGNWIYYIYEKEGYQYIAKMKLDGKDNQRISKLESSLERYETIYIKGNKIYYIMSKTNNNYDTKYYLYKMNKKGEKIQEICKLDTDVRYINMQEDKIYYTVSEDYETQNIYSIEYNGTNKGKIRKLTSVKGLNITKNWIVFSAFNEDYETVIKMISIDGEKEKQI